MQTRIDLGPNRCLTCLAVRVAYRSRRVSSPSPKKAVRNSIRSARCLRKNSPTRLIYAKQRVPFVQANLIEMEQDDLAAVDQFRELLLQHGVWANKPVPLYPYPGSPDYTKRWGQPDERAWERAHDYYLDLYDQFSDIQDQRPLPLAGPRTSDAGSPMTSPRHILMTADTVGGVWTYAVELARGLTANGIRVSLATMGAPLSREQGARFNSVTSRSSRVRTSSNGWNNPWQDVDAAGEWLLDLNDRLQPDLIHLNNYAHGAP